VPQLPISICCGELRHCCSFTFFAINIFHLSTNPRSFPIRCHLARTHTFSFASLKAPSATPTCTVTPCCPYAQIRGRIHPSHSPLHSTSLDGKQIYSTSSSGPWGRDEMLESHDVVPSEVGAEEDEEGGSWRGSAELPLLAGVKTSFRNV
jgi:hypothetical protein